MQGTVPRLLYSVAVRRMLSRFNDALCAQARQVPTVRRSVALTVRRWPDKW
jgi:hypothetical protein